MLKQVYDSKMESTGSIDCRLRQRLRDERERRGWSQIDVAKKLDTHASTICKIEVGDRAVRVDELLAYADLFKTSTDTLLGRGRASDLAWTAGNLTGNAQRMAGDIARMRQRLHGEYDDLRVSVIHGGEAVDHLLEVGGTALLKLGEAQEWLNRLANQFPLPTGGS